MVTAVRPGTPPASGSTAVETYRPAPSLDAVGDGSAALSRGSSGTSVSTVQGLLNRAGATPALVQDGLFGPRTEAAVERFQRAQGLDPSGVVDGPTLARLRGDSTYERGGQGGTAPRLGEPAPPGSMTAGSLARADEARRAGPLDPANPTLALPPRAGNAMTGSQFLEATRGMTRAQREDAILREVRAGNVPDFLRQLKPVDVSLTGRDGQTHTGRYFAAPDYLAIGSDQDFVRIPMSPRTAQAIADASGTQLPTRRMVDQIYGAAGDKLRPQPLTAGPQMMSNAYYAEHQARVERQRQDRGFELGALTAGDKKDLVVTNRLDQHPDRVAIYGWHQPNGRPIQGLSTVHEASYADYSHGARLIGGTMLVDGQPRAIADVLRDPALAGLVSDEGAIRNPRASRP